MALDSVWGLDIGQCALKAVKARLAGQLVEVLAFDHIEYRQPLSTAGTDASATIREALGTFLSRNEVDDSAFAVSIAAGRSALIRFIKLPPVDRKKVPDIVRYEASQQIPFPLEDVIWDHQLIDRQYAPGEELEVGIFAMRREAIFDFLSNLMVSGIEVDNIQLAAVALYNAVRFDQPVEDGAIMAVDIGAENTNLVVVDGNTVWTRALPIGGNDFTRAIATKYNLDFEQAEQLKRSLDRSKRAPEVFEAIRPSLRSMLDEIQRSAGYYRSLHKGAKFVKLLGFGGGFRMYGVQRFLEAGLAYPVEVYQKTNNVVVDAAVNLQFFKKSTPAFGAALGLAIQGLGVGGINTTLMPPTIIKERILKRKRPALIAAAALICGAFIWPVASAYTKPVAYDLAKHEVHNMIKQSADAIKEFDKQRDDKAYRAQVQGFFVIPSMRYEQVKAFDVLVKSIPSGGDASLYIQSIRLDSGGAGWVKERLVNPQEVAGPGQRQVFDVPDASKGNVIERSDAPKETRSLSRRKSAEEREAEIERRYTAMEDQFAAAMERRMAASEARAGRAAAAPRTGVRAVGAQAEFDGVAQFALVDIETTHPEGVTHIRKLCEEMGKVPGVMFCNYAWSDTTTFLVDRETGARLEDGTRVAKPMDKVSLTTVRIQWVYKEGSTKKITIAKPAAQPARAAGAAAAPPAAEAEPVEPEGP